MTWFQLIDSIERGSRERAQHRRRRQPPDRLVPNSAFFFNPKIVDRRILADREVAPGGPGAIRHPDRIG